MSYVGGKHAIRKQVASLIIRECARHNTRTVYEPFCGGLHATAELGRRGYRVHASDLAEPAVILYRALRLGWTPSPASFTYDQWRALKDAHEKGERHPLISYAGFQHSMNAIFFTSYAPPSSAEGRLRALRRRVKAARFASLKWSSYAAVTPPPGSVVYCDPPYANTHPSAYRAVSKDLRRFDSSVFWEWYRARADEGTTVLVSEYTAPDDTDRVWSRCVAVGASHHAGKSRQATEAVYRLKGKE